MYDLRVLKSPCKQDSNMTSLASHEVQTQLYGFFRSDFESDEKVVIDVQRLHEDQMPPQDVVVHDGRELQRLEDDGSDDFESKFFHKHGFVLLPHASKVKNWDSGAAGPTDALSPGVDRNISSDQVENEIATKYKNEVEGLIRTKILPNQSLVIEQPDQLLRRGKNTAHPFFGSVVHNDYGTSADDFSDNLLAFGDENAVQGWQSHYNEDEVAGYMIINFWRTVHMSEPLRHMPLAILDAASVEPEDLVSSGLKGFTYTGRITNQLSVRFNENQKWYYYPDITVDEVLVLNLFNCFKNQANGSFKQCFHSAFENPLTPADAEERQSCEHRVNVFVLNS